MKYLLGFVLSAPIWFVMLIITNTIYIKAGNYFGPETQVGYWLGIAFAGMAGGAFIQFVKH